MRLVLSREVPQFVATGVTPVVARFLDDYGVTLVDVTHFVLHPGGAKVMATLVNELERTGGRYGLQTMCEGGGMANATIIERIDG